MNAERGTVDGLFRAGYPTVSDSLASRRRDLFSIFAEIAQKLRPWAIGKQEYCALSDAMRGRLSGRTIEYMTRIAARSPLPFVVEDGMREAVLYEMAHPTPPCAFEASKSEQHANEPLNLAQIIAAEERTPVRWLHVAELCGPQLHATKLLRDAAWLQARKVS